jgi:acyl-CoA reductase-like NAD-dependent aldehyde dehydrogenase/uncharacterized protein (DUF2141 family)
MTADEAQERMAKARAAQALWAARTVEDRVRSLRPLRQAIAAHVDEVVRTMGEDMGKPPMDALAGDVMVTLEQLRWYEQHAPRLLRSRRVGKPPLLYSGARFTELNEPYGVALVIAPWNYPVQLSLVPAATALFAGNAVVLKCSEHTPLTAALIEELCASANLPDGLVQVSCEPPPGCSALLECRPDLIFFTGSSRTGREVAKRAAEWMIPTVMELGGKDAALVFDSCNLERTADGLVYGSFSNAGQVCVGTKRIYVERGIYEEFLRMFLARVEKLRMGETVESDMGRVRAEGVEQRLREQVEDALQRGAKMRTRWNSDEKASDAVVLTDVPEDAALLQEESFGPVVCVAAFDSEEDAIRKANSSPYALSASVWTGDKTQGERVAARMQSGSCAVNDVIRNIANPEASFGGNGLSGHGRYHGAEGLRAFSRTKSIMHVSRGRSTEMHWFPFRAKTFARLRGLMRLRHLSGAAARWRAFREMWVVLLVLAASGFMLKAAPQATPQGMLTIDVKLPAAAHGQIGYLVFSRAAGFPSNAELAFRRGFVPLDRGGSTDQQITIGPLPPGTYAVSLYLDENGNQKLDKNWLGIPKEPVGVSREPKGSFGPPRFEDCVFAHGQASERITIKLVECCKP